MKEVEGAASPQHWQRRPGGRNWRLFVPSCHEEKRLPQLEGSNQPTYLVINSIGTGQARPTRA